MDETKEQTARKALQCLFIAVEESVASDIQQKVLSAFDEMKSEIERLKEFEWKYKELCK